MKNQVNKKVSKLLIALLSLVIMSVACVSLTACNKECTHSKFSLSADTATCVSGGFITHTCDDCGYAYMEPTPAKGHSYGTAEIIPATCTTGGYTVKTCTVCGAEEKTNLTAATGHLHTAETVVNATCVQNGSKTVVCQDCQTVISSETLLATGHAFVDNVVAATCGAAGYTIRTCATCQEVVYVQGDPATGNHNYEEVSRIEATCNAAGTVQERCTVCDKEKTTLIPKTGIHNYGEVTVVDATCKEAAHRERTCVDCGTVEKYDYNGDVANHAFDIITKTEATCTAKGIIVEECAYCGEKKLTEVDKLAHDYAPEVTVVPATCETDGYKYVTCTRCGDMDITATIDALGHDYSEVAMKVEPTCTANGYETVKCARCGKYGTTTVLPKLAHEYDATLTKTEEATCTTAGKVIETCKLCGNQFTTTIIEPTGHSWVEVTRVEATCTADGQLVEKCQNCSINNITTLKSAGHVWEARPVAATCTTPEMVKDVCAVCAAEKAPVAVEGGMPALGHAWTLVETVAATCLNDGYKAYVCTNDNCGEENVEVLKAVEHTYVITDALTEKVTVEALLSETGKYSYLPDWQKANILTVYEEVKDDAAKLAEYYTVAEATCTTPGQTLGRCDICHNRYTVASTDSLGHVWGNVMTHHENTCYNAGYDAWECERCHAQAGTAIDTIKTGIVEAKAHVMTLKEGTAEELKIYAKPVAGVLKYYQEAACTTELSIAACNVFVLSGEEKFVFYCDVCGAMANDAGKIATGTYNAVAVSKEHTVNIDGLEMKVFVTEEYMGDAGKVASADHNFENATGKIDPAEVITCGYISRSYVSCKVCEGRHGAYAAYNLTAPQETTETYNRPGNVLSVYYEQNYTEHFEIYTYRTYYHKAVQVTKAPSCTDVEQYVYVCGRSAIAGEQAECGNYFDVTGKTYDEVVASGKTLSGGIEVAAATEYVYTLIEKTGAPANVVAVAAAYAATLEGEEKEAFLAQAFYALWDTTFVCEGVYTNTFATEKAAGHAFADAYTIIAVAADGITYSAPDCNSAYLVAVRECTKCGKYNYINQEGGSTTGIGATDLIICGAELIEAENTEGVLVNLDNKIANVKHGIATVDAAGTITWTNVLYKNAGNVACAADAEGAIAYAVNPAACPADCDNDDPSHVHVYACKNFTCATCSETVYGTHAYDIASGKVDCWNRQSCVLCGEITKNYAHKEPTATCTDSWGVGDGYFHCEVCGIALQKLTPHKAVVATGDAATCTTAGTWNITCALCNEPIGNGQKVTGLDNNADFTAQWGTAVTDATDIDGVITFSDAWKVAADALNHAWTDKAYAQANSTTENVLYIAETCKADGKYYVFCTNCNLWRDGVSENAVEDKERSAQTILKHAHDFSGTPVVTEATCTTEGTKVYTCLECGEETHTETIAIIPHEYTGEPVVTEATCTEAGSKVYTCVICNTEKKTEPIAALGHSIVLVIDNTGVKDCVNGYPVKKEDGRIQFYCQNGCGIDAANITENGEPKKVVYQKDVKTYVDGKLALTQPTVDGSTVGAEITYTVGEHTYTEFDMQNGHETSGNAGEFKMPTASEPGSAYWYCEICDARVYRPDSITLADVNNPSKNRDWRTTVAPTITEIAVTGNVDLGITLTTATYFEATNEGFVLKADKVDELVNAIYTKLIADGTPVSATINGASVTLSGTDETADKAAIQAQIATYKYTTELKIVKA